MGNRTVKGSVTNFLLECRGSALGMQVCSVNAFLLPDVQCWDCPLTLVFYDLKHTN